MPTILAFTVEQAARLSDLSTYQIRYWADTEFFNPSFVNEKRRPYGRVYSFRDVVALRTLAVLRQEHKVPLQELRKVGAWLDEHYEDPWASLRFFVVGRRVYFQDPHLHIRREGRRPEQTVIPIEMTEVAAATEAAARKLTERTPDEIGVIRQNRYISHNAPIIAGTRIRTETIWQFHNAGYSVKQILREYPRLNPEDVQAAVQFEEQRRLRVG